MGRTDRPDPWFRKAGRDALRLLIQSQVICSRAIDRWLPPKFSRDGYSDVLKNVIPTHLATGLLVYDVGGGKRPCISPADKSAHETRVVGLDISAEELAQAPEHAYDRLECADVSEIRGNQDADLVISIALLEHVPDVRSAFRGIASIMRPGGSAIIFVPCRTAPFARLNRLLPESVKRSLLHRLYPQTAGHRGFPSYYDCCTPREFRNLASEHGLTVSEERYYYTSSYFSFCFPIYLLWRLWGLLKYAISEERPVETFCVILRKPS